ncbi:MAG: hypothetical protein IME98_04760, partial [Proteobacteria bacterium]|nr:hypothetical protein [Pseudomonadota bacterium]
MRKVYISRTYLLSSFPVLIAFVMVALFALSCPSRANAAVQVVNALEENRGDWRNYYRDKFFADMHSIDLMETLKAYSTEDPVIKESIRLRLAGEWKESINGLTGLVVDSDTHNRDEVAYVLGLIYESLAFFPEAMGNYDRLEFKRGEAKGAFYYKTVLRKSYVKFITGLKYSKLLSM